MMRAAVASLVCLCGMNNAFVLPRALSRQPLSTRAVGARRQQVALKASGEQETTNADNDEVFEVFEEPTSVKAPTTDVQPTTSSGQVEEEEGGPFKKFRVLFYIGISLIPILFLLPFLSSSKFEPLDPSIIEEMQRGM